MSIKIKLRITTDRARHGPIMYGALSVGGLALAAMGLPIGVAGLVAYPLLLGIALVTANLLGRTLGQERIPREVFGRVSSLSCLSSFLVVPLGYTIAGRAAGLIGAPQVFLIGGLLTATIAALALPHPATRSLD